MDLELMLTMAKVWSNDTFGPGRRTGGLIDHIKKELVEIAESPDDLMEWMDIVILGFDGAWRAGHSPEDIVAALQAKYRKNFDRSWPDWREGSEDFAIEHVRDGS